MSSTFMGLEIAKTGLSAHQQALNVTGHNISNADNKNYSRQKIDMQAMNPLYLPGMNRAQAAGTIGQGVEVAQITRVRDQFIDDKISMTEQSKEYWSTRETVFHQIEIIYNEPADESIRSQLDKFWQSWQELSQYPEEMSHREMVVTTAKELTFRMKNTFSKLDDFRKELDDRIVGEVSMLNDMANSVATLNSKIAKSTALGDKPNDLLDKRDALIQQMSSLADIQVKGQDPDEMMIYIGSQMLVQGNKSFALQTKSNLSNEGLSMVSWKENGEEAIFSNGKIQSLIEMRDTVLKEHLNQNNLLATNIADIVNEVHRDGFGLTKETNIDFFTLKPLSRTLDGNYDMNGDGQNDTTAIFKVAGKNKIDSEHPIGISGHLTFHKNNIEHTEVTVSYGPDETLQDVIHKINRADAGVVSYLNHNNNLVLKGDVAEDTNSKNFMIRHIEDSGQLLVGYAGILNSSGAEGAYDYRRINEIQKLQSNLERITLTPAYNPAASIQVSDMVKNNPALVATAQGKDVGGVGDNNKGNGLKDGSNALKIAQALRHNSTMVGHYNNTDDFYNSLIAKMGIESKTAQDELQTQKLILGNLENLRQSISGVNLDEEMSNMVQFQHGYNASAKVISVMDEMLEKIINLLR